MAAVSMTSAFVATATFAVCAATVAADDSVTRGERIGRLIGYFVWAVVIAFVVPESWGWQRPLAITSTFSLGFVTGVISAKPIDRLRMKTSRQWEQLDERSQQWQRQEDAPSIQKRSAQSSVNGRIRSGSSTAYSETSSSEGLTQSAEGK